MKNFEENCDIAITKFKESTGLTDKMPLTYSDLESGINLFGGNVEQLHYTEVDELNGRIIGNVNKFSILINKTEDQIKNKISLALQLSNIILYVTKEDIINFIDHRNKMFLENNGVRLQTFGFSHVYRSDYFIWSLFMPMETIIKDFLAAKGNPINPNKRMSSEFYRQLIKTLSKKYEVPNYMIVDRFNSLGFSTIYRHEI